MSAPASINVQFEGITQSSINRRVLADVVAAIDSKVPDHATVDLVVAGDMTASCRRRMDSSLAPRFSARRGQGRIAGKTFNVDGRQSIVIPAEAFSRTSQALTTRTAHHEALHVVMHQRNEDPGGFVIPVEHRNVPHNPIYPIAVNFWGEFRIERALSMQEGLRAADVGNPAWERTATVLLEIPPMLETAMASPSIVERANLTRDALDLLVVALSYLAGVQLSDRPEDADGLITSTYWARFVGDVWDSLLDIARIIPAADVPSPREHCIGTFVRLTEILHDLYRQIGFEFQLVNGDMHWYPVDAAWSR